MEKIAKVEAANLPRFFTAHAYRNLNDDNLDHVHMALVKGAVEGRRTFL